MEPKNPIIIAGVDVSGCCQYMPRHMEDYDIDTLDYCRHYLKPCKDIDVKYCYYKQLKRKEKENERYEQALIVIEDIAKADFNHTCWETYARQLKQIIQIISEVLDE